MELSRLLAFVFGFCLRALFRQGIGFGVSDFGLGLQGRGFWVAGFASFAV